MKKIRMGLVAGAAAMLAVLPVSPAAAQRDCTIAGPYVVYDVVDCVHYILVSAIDWPPR